MIRKPAAPGASGDVAEAASFTPADAAPAVAVIGGGLAGLAACVALSDAGLRVELFEARRGLGGRAASFQDPETGEWIDHCQHVSMGCCTNLADFCRRTGLEDAFSQQRVLHFFGPDGRRCDFTAQAGLPPPLHLAPGLMQLPFLTLSERTAIGRALLRLARLRDPRQLDEQSIGSWLRGQHHPPRAIERFWSVVLQSALGESLDRAALRYARQVFVEGFMAHADACILHVPRISLAELYDVRLRHWLADRGVTLHLETPVRGFRACGERVTHLMLGDGQERLFDYFIVAVPWSKLGRLFSLPPSPSLPCLEEIARIESSPITAAHLWFDRPIMQLPHAVLVGRLSQWVFFRSVGQTTGKSTTSAGHYYQVVISASRELSGRDRADVTAEIVDDLRTCFPPARQAALLRSRLVTDPAAVFSVAPGVDRLRPAQQTSIPNLFLAGDWTQTKWPATMESAVRSGYLAAEGVLSRIGRSQRYLIGDLPPGRLARVMIG